MKRSSITMLFGLHPVFTYYHQDWILSPVKEILFPETHLEFQKCLLVDFICLFMPLWLGLTLRFGYLLQALNVKWSHDFWLSWLCSRHCWDFFIVWKLSLNIFALAKYKLRYNLKITKFFFRCSFNKLALRWKECVKLWICILWVADFRVNID